MTPHLHTIFTTEMQTWRIDGSATIVANILSDSVITQHARRIFRLAENSGRKDIILLGCGNGQLASALSTNTHEFQRIVVCETTPQRIREAIAAGMIPPQDSDERFIALADTSIWSLLFFLMDLGCLDGTCTLALNPEIAATEQVSLRKLHKAIRSSKLFSIPVANTGLKTPRLHVCAILHPEEPMLDDFLAHIPAWIAGCSIVWDGEHLPDAVPCCQIPLRHKARPLQGDFAAQRNTMLDMCPNGWTLYLDADERLSPETWQMLRNILASHERTTTIENEVAAHTDSAVSPFLPPMQDSVSDDSLHDSGSEAVNAAACAPSIAAANDPATAACAMPLPDGRLQGPTGLPPAQGIPSSIDGILFPRRTFHPDANHTRIGFGLWPDLQLRLFRNRPGVRFEGHIHEKLVGLGEGIAILPGHSIRHFSQVTKDRLALEQRLAVFDEAAGHKLHRLNEAYPRLCNTAFESFEDRHSRTLLLLSNASP